MGFAKTICNKTQGLKIAADNLRGRVYEVNHADLTMDAPTKDQAFRNVKFEVLEVNGRNLLTQFHSLSLTTDKIRSLLRKWCTLIEAPLEVTTADGYRLRLFAMLHEEAARPAVEELLLEDAPGEVGAPAHAEDRHGPPVEAEHQRRRHDADERRARRRDEQAL